MKPVKIMCWMACLLFLASLFKPIEQHAVSGPCSWPCLYPFTYTVFDNTILFVFAPLFLMSQLFFWTSFREFSMAAVYSFIGMGEILLLITPLFEARINSEFRQKLHFSLVFLAVVGIFTYGLVSDFRLGFDPLKIGYSFLILSFLVLFLSSILRFIIQRSASPSTLSS